MLFSKDYPKEKLEEYISKSLDPKKRTPEEEYKFWVNLEKEYLSSPAVKEKLSVRVMSWIRGYGPFTFGMATMFVGAYLLNELDPISVTHPELKEKLFFIEEPKRFKNYVMNQYEELVAKYKEV